MKKKLFTEAQIVAVLKQYEGGREAMDVCREYGISKATLFNWRRKYSGMETTHLKELKALQAAAARRKTVVLNKCMPN